MTAIGGDLAAYLSMLILAVVQGLTEFLPVSSSGHLALGQMLLRMGEGGLMEDVVLHMGTLLAVVVFYRAVLARLVRGTLGTEVGEIDGLSARQYVGLVVLGNVPAVVVGFTLKDRIEELFTSPWAVFAAMAATAVVLWSTRRRRRGEDGPGVRTALLIGLAQSVAILPGASRSGWTIAVALWLGVRPEAAARFSFLLSIPAICGAMVLQLFDHEEITTPVGALVLGFVVAALVGLFALRWLVALVRRMELHRFAVYLGVLVVTGVTLLLLR